MKYQTVVTPETLFINLNNPNWLILDFRNTLLKDSEAYLMFETSHIPGASYCFINHCHDSAQNMKSNNNSLSTSFDLVLKELNDFGYNENTQIIIYGNSDGVMVNQIWLFMRTLGFKDTAILQGGFKAWEDDYYPVTRNLQPMCILNESHLRTER